MMVKAYSFVMPSRPGLQPPFFEGPVWSAGRFRDGWHDSAQRQRLLEFLTLIEREPSI